MATGDDQSQIQLGYGGCTWGTGRVTACPRGPGATQRSGSVSDQDELHQGERYGEEAVTQSPLLPGRRVCDEDETEVMIRQGKEVTQLAAHSIADDKRSRFLEISMKKERVQWRSPCKLGMSLAASGRRRVFQFL